MKIRYGDRVFTNEEDLIKFVIENVDSDYLRDYVDDTFEGYEDNLNEWSPSDLYEYIVGSYESIREDAEGLWEYLYENCSDNYLGFDPNDYDGTETTCTIGDLDFDIEFEDGDIEEDADDE